MIVLRIIKIYISSYNRVFVSTTVKLFEVRKFVRNTKYQMTDLLAHAFRNKFSDRSKSWLSPSKFQVTWVIHKIIAENLDEGREYQSGNSSNQRWEFIKENKKVRTQEERKKTRTRPRKRSRKRENKNST